MGGHLVIDPSATSGKASPTILAAFQPGDSSSGQKSSGLEVLGIFREDSGSREEMRGAVWERLEALMPFLERSVVGETSFRCGRFPLYAPQARGRRPLEHYYLSEDLARGGPPQQVEAAIGTGEQPTEEAEKG